MSSTMACRVCANLLPTEELMFQFGAVADIYFRLTALEQPKEKFSDEICRECHDKLLLFDEFRTMCLAAYVQLSNTKILPLGDIKQETQSNVACDPQLDEINPMAMVVVKEEAYDDETESDTTDSVKDEGMSDDEKPKKAKRKPKAEPPGKISCDQCDKFFFNSQRYEAHLREHQGLKPVTCEICSKEFAKFTYLKVHMQFVHAEEKKRIKCDVDGCELSFASKAGMVSHKALKHLGKELPKKQHVCEYCGKVYKSASLLGYHRNKHEGIKKHICSLCGRGHDSRHKLKQHMWRHEGIKQFQCSVCGMKAVTISQLKVHMNSHTREKQYQCHLCEATFNSSGNKSRHVKLVHEGEKKFKCDYCDRAFGKAETLKHHVMIHTGEKPHSCDICGKRFIQLVALQKHVKTHNK